RLHFAACRCPCNGTFFLRQIRAGGVNSLRLRVSGCSSSGRTPKSVMASARNGFQQDHAEANVTIWKEALFGAELLLLHASPVYYGLGIPRGDGSAVVLIPGFLGSDLYMAHLSAWLSRVGYRPYLSGIHLNAECPNLLIKYRLAEIIEKALRDTRRKIHLIGHSLGGMMARSIATQQPGDVASVT